MNKEAKIEIICPLYNAGKYLKKLDENIKKQINVNLYKISYVYTESNDKTEEILKELQANYIKIKASEFSHSLSREMIALNSESDILVFITQDIEIKDDKWLEKLVEPIVNNESQASFSRQLTKYDNIEKYTRERNYPQDSYIVSKNDLKEKGLQTFFFSDASSAINTKIYKELNGYDSKDLPTNEDMYIAYKLIMKDYKIKYCADSVVYHSHKFTLKQLYRRYYDTGVFFKQNSYLDKFGTNKSGGGMAVYILKRAIQDKNIRVIFEFVPNMVIRFIGMKVGKINGKNI